MIWRQRSSPLSLPDPYVAQHDVGPFAGDQRERLRRGRRLARDHHLVDEMAEHRDEAVQHHLVVVHQDESQRGRSRGRHGPRVSGDSTIPPRSRGFTRISTRAGEGAIGAARCAWKSPIRKASHDRAHPSRSPSAHRPLGAARRFRAPRRRDPRAVRRRRRPDPVGRDGRGVRPEPHLRPGRDRGGPGAQPGRLRGPSDGGGARRAATPVRRGRLRADHRPRRGVHPSPSHARPDPGSRRTQWCRAQSAHARGPGGTRPDRDGPGAGDDGQPRLRRAGLHPVGGEEGGPAAAADRRVRPADRARGRRRHHRRHHPAARPRAGADVFISGSWMYAHSDGKAAAVRQLRAAAVSAAQKNEEAA